jgi:hypothetical protein
MIREVTAHSRGLLEARAISTTTSRAGRGGHIKSYEEVARRQEPNTVVEMQGGDETQVLPRSSLVAKLQRLTVMVRVNSRHLGIRYDD